MTRDEAISQGKQSLDQAQSDAFGVAYDAGVSSVPLTAGGEGDGTPFSQADLDAAVQKVTDADSVHMKELQEKIDLDASDLAAVKDSFKKQVQAVLDSLSAPAAPAPEADPAAPAPQA